MQQLDPKSVWLFFINTVLSWLIIFIVLGAYLAIFAFGTIGAGGNLPLGFFGWLFAVILVLPIIFFIWAKLSYRFYRYELTDLGFRKESGVIYKRYVTIPYDRIQNVDIHRGIFARILGLSDLHIQTAGASAVFGNNRIAGIGAEGRLPGVSRDTAEQLRDELIVRARQSRSQGL